MTRPGRRQTLVTCIMLLHSWGERASLRNIAAVWADVRSGYLGRGDYGPFTPPR